jgi:hypothetical protein
MNRPFVLYSPGCTNVDRSFLNPVPVIKQNIAFAISVQILFFCRESSV